MRILSALLLIASAIFAQSKITAADEPQITAAKLTHDGNLIHGAGAVKVRLGSLTFNAESATVHSDTGEVELRNAVVTLPPRADRNLFRYEKKIIFSDQAVVLAADTPNIKHAYLRGSGHVHIRTTENYLDGDEIEMLLTIGDATVKGNLRDGRFESRRPSTHILPPDIIKNDVIRDEVRLP